MTIVKITGSCMKPGLAAVGFVSFTQQGCPAMQTGFYHRNSVYQAYVDTPLAQFTAEEPQVPQSLRMILTAELCASLAASDLSQPPGCRLPALLEQAFSEALDDRYGTTLASTPSACTAVVLWAGSSQCNHCGELYR